ncbi:hypothetical protein pqer_cds_1001 [Pandoravirus quercus]|uniref:Uncharacterized protein n=1 Tax=Pandoravirus quercus TaxID=2107709 RepID=A0A2U7UAF5_9VIRU|nr:hypothetical protein pqer_cds_1001 [Pandoravirus quercus]AVK75423.1 hypothetical protein pqer_cds_1001 [Pandoravirus quercus]
MGYVSTESETTDTGTDSSSSSSTSWTDSSPSEHRRRSRRLRRTRARTPRPDRRLDRCDVCRVVCVVLGLLLGAAILVCIVHFDEPSRNAVTPLHTCEHIVPASALESRWCMCKGIDDMAAWSDALAAGDTRLCQQYRLTHTAHAPRASIPWEKIAGALWVPLAVVALVTFCVFPRR